MNNPNSETQIEEVPAETPSADTQPVEPPQPPEFQPLDLRRRLRELLSVPERDRSDELWDEIIELEIQLAPGNRIAGNEPSATQPRHNNQQRHGKQGGGGGGGHHQNAGAGAGAGNAQQKKHRPRTKNNRRPRQGGKPGGEAA